MTERRRVIGTAAALTLGLIAPLLISVPAGAFPSKLSANGELDFTYGSAVESSGGPSTGYKPESKLFYTGDGSSEAVRWWAVLGTSGPSPSAGVWLFELVNHVWTSRIRLPSADPWAKADTVFDGSTLYVSTRDNKSSVSGNPRESDLYKIPYLGNGSWGGVSGPSAITTASPETLTIDVDSTGRIWTTFEQSRTIKVGYTAPGGTAFTFFTVSKTQVDSDDISTIAAFGGNRIGVLWSDQVAKKDFFAWHLDTDAPQANWTTETAYGGGVGACPTANSTLCADDHLNIKAYGDQVYVAIKTSLNNTAGAPGDPLIAPLRRSSAGTRSAFPVSTVGQDATRPITVLSPSQNAIWVWAARSGEIDVWEIPFTAPSFTSSAFTTWIKSSSSLDDPTSTRQVTTGATGTVVEASIKSKNQYWHNEFLASSGPPTGPAITGFSPTSGPVGTAVTITGSGFTGASSVRFHGKSASFTVNSD